MNIDDAVCNRCGRSLDFWDKQEDFSIIKKLGYGTKYDGQRLRYRVCCSCIEDLIFECVICPTYNDDEKNGGII